MKRTWKRRPSKSQRGIVVQANPPPSAAAVVMDRHMRISSPDLPAILSDNEGAGLDLRDKFINDLNQFDSMQVAIDSYTARKQQRAKAHKKWLENFIAKQD